MTDRQKLMYQIFAAFMIASMALSGLAYFIGYGLTSSSNSDTTNGNENPSQQSQLQNPSIGFDAVGGNLIDADFNSISDALKISPQGVLTAQFTNVERSRGTLLQDYIAQSMQQQNDLYNENVGNSYGAMLEGGNILQYNIIPSKSLNFGYMVNPTPYKGYNLLVRENGLQNVIGTPVMLTNSEAVSNATLDIISGDGENAYAKFAPVLNYSSNGDIIAYIDTALPIANIFYSGFQMGTDPSADKGTRTLIYQEISVNASSKIDALANNETDAIDVTVKTYGDENITVVKLVSDLNSLFMANIG